MPNALHLMMPELHYLYDNVEAGDKERFVYSCSGCSCILNVSISLEPVGRTVESLENRCPSCGSSLESSVSCRSARIPEAWSEITRSDYSTGGRNGADVEFRTAASLRGLSFNVSALDALVGHWIDPGWSVCFVGRGSNAVAEFVCFRAQLSKEQGGSDSGVVAIDGGNRSDLYLFGSFAKLYGVNPRKALRRVVTSRSFTMYQTADLVTRQLGRMVDEHGAKVVVLLDILGMLNEEQNLQADEATRLAGAVRRGLDEVRKKRKIITFTTLVTRTEHDRAITQDADILVELEESSTHHIQGTLVKHPMKKEQVTRQFTLRDLMVRVR